MIERFEDTKVRIARLTKENVDEMNVMLAFICKYREVVGEKTAQLKELAESMGESSGILLDL